VKLKMVSRNYDETLTLKVGGKSVATGAAGGYQGVDHTSA